FNGLERPQKGRRELDLPIGTPGQVRALRSRDREIEALEKENDDVSDAERRERIAGLRREIPDLPRGYYFDEPNPQAAPTFLLIRGKAATPGPEVAPAVPEVIARIQPRFPAPGSTSLRRLTLAKWLASPENPLTARVIVNRVWQHHFG